MSVTFSVRLTPRQKRRLSSRSEDEDEEEDSVGDMRDFDSYRRGGGDGGSARTKRGGRGRAASSASNTSSSSVAHRQPAVHRQRMPLGGGYGGMFQSNATVGSSISDNNSDGETSLLTGRDG